MYMIGNWYANSVLLVCLLQNQLVHVLFSESLLSLAPGYGTILPLALYLSWVQDYPALRWKSILPLALYYACVWDYTAVSRVLTPVYENYAAPCRQLHFEQKALDNHGWQTYTLTAGCMSLDSCTIACIYQLRVPLCAFILAHKHTLIFVNMIYMSSDAAPCTQEANWILCKTPWIQRHTLHYLFPSFTVQEFGPHCMISHHWVQ